MSAISVNPIIATASMVCNRCHERWESDEFTSSRWGDEVRACQPAFDLGWRVYVGGRSQLAYCPLHEPSRDMRIIHPGGRYEEE